MIFKGLNTIHRIHFSPWAKGPKIMKVIQMMDHLDFLFKFNRPQKTFESSNEWLLCSVLVCYRKDKELNRAQKKAVNEYESSYIRSVIREFVPSDFV